MAETTENGFTIPEYTDAGDIPGMVRGNVSNAERLLTEIRNGITEVGENATEFSEDIRAMREMMGTLSSKLDTVNGESG